VFLIRLRFRAGSFLQPFPAKTAFDCFFADIFFTKRTYFESVVCHAQCLYRKLFILSAYFQISVPVQPGNSGGALVDERGNVIGIVSAKLDASVALAASGALPENVNYAVKSSFLLSFLESVPAVSAKLKEPVTADRKFEDVVKSAQDAAVLVLVY
jgi:hypothetical protein